MTHCLHHYTLKREINMGEVATPQSRQHKGEVIEDLYRAGLELKRCQLKRAHPQANPQELEAHLKAWLLRIPDGVESLGQLRVFNVSHALSSNESPHE